MGTVDDVNRRPARDLLLELLGVDASSGPLGYWRSHEIRAGLHALRIQLNDAVGQDLERWWSTATDAEQGALISRANPPRVRTELRPWVVTDALWGTRIPYVPLAAFVHAMAMGEHPTVGATAEAHGITEATTPWEMLEVLDERIEGTPVPQDLQTVASGLRMLSKHQPDIGTDFHHPGRWLTQEHGSCDWDMLRSLASEALAEEEKRQSRLSANRAAKKAAAS